MKGAELRRRWSLTVGVAWVAAVLLSLLLHGGEEGPGPGQAWAAGSEAGAQILLDLDPSSPSYGTFQVTGLAPALLEELDRRRLSQQDWSEVFGVYTGGAAPRETAGQPTVLGTFSVDGRGVRFVPRFPLVAGQAYYAQFRGLSAAGPPLVSAAFRLDPRPTRASTVVEQVYPTGGEVPENLLKLYVHFSAPMSRHQARHHLRLETAPGEEVASPFVAPDHELWNHAGDRLTLFFDPGRIKRGVGPHLELGPPLRQGQSYRLTIDSRWRDAQGNPLKESFKKTFRVVAADRSPPRPEDWRLLPPRGADEVLTVLFPEPLDRALLERFLEVRTGDDEAVGGEVEIGRQETRWTFRPDLPWRAGTYEVRVDPRLEDLAGNTPHRLFDAAMGGAGETVQELTITRLPFQVLGTR